MLQLQIAVGMDGPAQCVLNGHQQQMHLAVADRLTTGRSIKAHRSKKNLESHQKRITLLFFKKISTQIATKTPQKLHQRMDSPRLPLLPGPSRHRSLARLVGTRNNMWCKNKSRFSRPILSQDAYQ